MSGGARIQPSLGAAKLLKRVVLWIINEQNIRNDFAAAGA
jgi:hypothetical protein